MARKATKEFEVHPYVQFLMDRYNAYRTWIESQGIPILSGSWVSDARTVGLADWERKGGKGAFLVFSDQRVADGYVCEIPAGGELRRDRHLFEEIVLIASGRGATTVWYEEEPEQTFEWQRGSLFAIPLNAWYQHFNASASEPVRYIALTSAPLVFEMYRAEDFIFNTRHAFRDRFDPHNPNFFAGAAEVHKDYYGGILHSNFIPDIRNIELVPREARGKGTKNMYIHMAGGAMFAHVSEFPVGRYKKAHRHGPGAHVCMLDSSGYTLMWNEGEQPQRYDWQEGSVISPPAGMWHQHYNTGAEPARFIALHANTAVGHDDKGIEQLEFEDEERFMRKMFVEECAKNGVEAAIEA